MLAADISPRGPTSAAGRPVGGYGVPRSEDLRGPQPSREGRALRPPRPLGYVFEQHLESTRQNT